MSDDDPVPDRVAEKAREIVARLQPVLSDWPADELIGLAREMAELELKYQTQVGWTSSGEL